MFGKGKVLSGVKIKQGEGSIQLLSVIFFLFNFFIYILQWFYYAGLAPLNFGFLIYEV